MTEIPETRICKNCGSSQVENYCSHCGQKVYKKRFTIKSFFAVLFDALNLEKGILYTLKMLFVNPGKVIHDYLSGSTKRYVNPLNYLLIIAGINAFLVLYLNILDNSVEMSNNLLNYQGTENYQETMELQQRFIEVIKKYVNFMPLLMIPFASLVSKWYYYSGKLYYGEHLIIMTYLFGQSLIIGSFLSLSVLIFPDFIKIFPFVNISITLIYFVYALKRIYKRSVVSAIFGSIFIYVFGLILFMVVLMILIFLTFFIIALMGFDLKSLL
ncbi:MAG: DUF3667 domain-containing protein [Prolixibacteraceae bacterium]|nr:DUF3667 domain-containing protein [Prolixibacteraceae bacterium]MBN2775930.1 DUF3667 domain-containing protein [Prolixibacteraceae bacterium]